MEVETLGIARSLGWKLHMRCANGYRQETRSMRCCVYRKQLDLETLVCYARDEPCALGGSAKGHKLRSKEGRGPDSL